MSTMLRSLQKSVRPALSSSWRAAQPTAPGPSALGLGFALPAPAHPTANRNGNRSFHKSFTSANWRQPDAAAPAAISEAAAAETTAPKPTFDPAVTRFIGIWNVPKNTTEEEIREYLTQACGITEEFGVRMVLSERHPGWNVFLDLQSIEAAQKALEAIARTPFKNMTLHASSSRGPKAPNGRTNTVVIGNVGRQIPTEELTGYLQKKYPGVKSARVSEIRIPAVFVQFENEDFAEVALDELKNLDSIQMPSGQQTHRIFATFANQSHGEPVVRSVSRDDWETASQVSRGSSRGSSRVSRRPPQQQQQQRGREKEQKPFSKLWVGGLPANYDKAELEKLFAQKPGFSRMFYPNPENFDKPPRWARVGFESKAHAEAVLKDLSGVQFGNAALEIQYANSQAR